MELYKSFNSAQTRSFDVRNIHVKPQFSAQFWCDSLEINPASTFSLLYIKSSKFNKNCKQKRYAAVGFSGGKLKPLLRADFEAGGREVAGHSTW